MSTSRNLSSSVLIAYVAVQHLQHGRQMLEIAREMRVSRFTVSRMIKKAREDGLVEVVTHLPVPLDMNLSVELAQQYGLDAAIVGVPSRAGESDVRHL